ncbi:MAG: aminoglycoside phosphotransferase family protein [Candidatus Anstonellales archaeon]
MYEELNKELFSIVVKIGKKHLKRSNFKIQYIPQGKIYHTFKLTTADNSYVVRVGGKLRRFKWGDLRSEKWAYEHIKDILPVPEFFEIGDMCGVDYSIASFIPGVVPNPTDINIAKLAGTILKKLHSQRFSRYGDINISNDEGAFISWSEFIEKHIQTYIDLLPRNIIPGKYLNLLKQIHQETNFTLEGSLLHGDFQRRNLLVNNGIISGIIDFDRCLIGDPYFDFGPILYHCEQNWTNNVIKGYFSDSSIPKHFYNKIYLYASVRALNVLSLIYVERGFIAQNVLNDLYKYLELGFNLIKI